MRVGRLLLLLITFGPCPHQWMLLLGSADSIGSNKEACKRDVDHPPCKCCHKAERPRKELPPTRPACCRRDMSYICEVSVHAPDQGLSGFLTILDASLTDLDAGSVTRRREPPSSLPGIATGRSTPLRI